MYGVYVLLCKDKSLYKGYSENIERRIKEHEQGLVPATKDKRPIEHVYSELYRDKVDAVRREQQLKTGWGRRYLRNVLKNTLSTRNMSKN